MSALLLNISPGPDLLYILSRTISSGRKVGIASALGVCSGAFVHVILAACGVSAILATSERAFDFLKYLGAAYLLYLGLKSLMTSPGSSTTHGEIESRKASVVEAYRQGVLIDVFNPKVALFFLAFFPQFILKEELESPVPFIFLGMTYALIGCIWYAVLSLFAGTFSASLKANPKADHWLQRFSGVIFILMGLKIAFPK